MKSQTDAESMTRGLEKKTEAAVLEQDSDSGSRPIKAGCSCDGLLQPHQWFVPRFPPEPNHASY